MFKKLLSNLPFNPSLINQLSFYAKRIHKEGSVRKTGLIILVLGMFVQIFAVLSPPQPTLASSNNDLINGGFTTRDQAVLHCLNASGEDYGRILQYYGITCTDVGQASTVTLQSTYFNRQLFSMGRISYGLPGEQPVNIPDANGGKLWLRYLWGWDRGGPPSTYKALSGTTKNGLHFFILYSCGNLTFIGVPSPPPPPPAPLPPPKPTPPPVKVTTISCDNLGMSVADGSRVNVGTTVNVRGQATGQNLPAGQKVNLYYDYVDTSTNKIITTVKSLDVPFKGTTASDPAGHPFTFKTAGSFAFRLTVKYDSGKVATGSASGDCVKHVVVQKPCEAAQTTQDLTACLDFHKKARNITANVTNANGTTARPGDIVEYTLLITNNGKVTVPKFVVQESISDILDYAVATDLHGGKQDKNGLVSWPALDIGSKKTVSKLITVKVKDPLPTTPASTSDPKHFDMTMTNVYGDTINIKLPPPVTKQTELITTQTLPNTGPGASLIIGFSVTAIVGYFFARSRLMAAELDEVRKEFATSGGH